MNMMNSIVFFLLHAMLILFGLPMLFVRKKFSLIIFSILVSLFMGLTLCFWLPSTLVLLLLLTYLTVDIGLLVLSSTTPKMPKIETMSMVGKVYASFIIAFTFLLAIWLGYEIWHGEFPQSVLVAESSEINLLKGFVQNSSVTFFLSATLIVPVSVGALLMIKSRS